MKAAMIRIIQVFIVLLGMSAMGVGIRFAIEVLGGQYKGWAGWAIGLAGWVSAWFILLIALITMIGAILIAWQIGKKERRN